VPAEETNAALIARALRGEAAATEALVRRHLRAAVAVALAVTRDAAEAEDVAQDAFIQAFEHLESCREPERFAGWLMRIVRHRALNVQLRRKRHATTTEQLTAAEPPQVDAPDAAGVGVRQRLQAGLDTLSPKQREVVLLHDLEGWTHREIADALDISEVMSRQHLFTARRALRARLGGAPSSGETDEG
jgi:RNA polymerase sigma-70 factor (ECF subfamily)